MAFRADEAAQAGYEDAEDYLVGRLRNVDDSERERSRAALRDLADVLGSAVKSYPTWHPLVLNCEGSREYATAPSRECGYQGLDHTVYFVNGFITCPYGDGGQKVIESVKSLPRHHAAIITAERLDVQFYSTDAVPILVKCEWDGKRAQPKDGLIPLSIAMPLLLEKEVPCAQWSQVAETWESMRHHFLGSPRGSRSSLFVTQETGQAMKKIWEALIYTGMFGPIQV